MARYQNKFIDIDPETCSLEELKAAIDKMHALGGFYETKQLAIKLFLNSVYGATASKYFVGHSTDVAESITLQGQDLNHYSENSVNKYFRGIYQSEEEYNRIIYVPLFEYIEKYDISETPNNITQESRKHIKNDILELNNNGNGGQPLEFYAKAKTGEMILAKLPLSGDAIMKEDYDETTKALLKQVKIKTTFGKYLGVPYEQIKDFNINLGRLTKQKPLTDKAFDNNFAYLGKSSYLEDDPTVSLTIAGDTDSISGDSLIYIDEKEIPIEDAFTKLKLENNDCILQLENGQEMVPGNNYKTSAFDYKSPLTTKNAAIKYIMRHKVSKAKYRIKSKSGKEVIVTGDHSCMVYRDGHIISVTAKEINPKTDKLIEIS